MQTNPLSQHSITALETIVPNTPEQKIPKSINGEGVKNNRKQVTASTSHAPDGRLCFRCKQPGHLKKDCTELPYCSKFQTRGHIPVKCPTKQQDGRQQDERCKSADKRHETCGEDWKKAQDRPQFSNKSNKCLNCTDNCRMHDCPTGQQPHASPTGNPAISTGIYKNNSQFQNHFPQQCSQQSASMVGISTPTNGSSAGPTTASITTSPTSKPAGKFSNKAQPV